MEIDFEDIPEKEKLADVFVLPNGYRQIPWDEKKYPFCTMGFKYALTIVDKKFPASIYTIGACKRFLIEVQDKFHPDFIFDPEAAEKYLSLTQRFEHVIGHWDTPQIKYEAWQCFSNMNIFGFISRETGFRRFRIAHIEVARGNAKSTMASQSGLYCLALDNPKGNQVATVATKKDQARIVLDASRQMARKNASFRAKKGVVVKAHAIEQPETASVMRSLSSEANSLDGLNDVLAICDELHAMKRSVFDVITSGMSKRKDSLTLCITTAGFDLTSVGYTQSAYAKQVCLGKIVDNQFFGLVYTLDEGDDIYDEDNWKKANPNWGVSVDVETFRQKAEKTKHTQADLPNFMIKHLNMWVGEAKAYYSQIKWSECYDPNLKLEDFAGERCMLAIDLAARIDITSKVYMFRKIIEDAPHYYVFFKNYLPKGTIDASKNDIYKEAVKSGELTATPGEVINFEHIEAEMEQDAKDFRIVHCGYDKWSAAELAQRLSSTMEMVQMGMNVATLSEPMKKLDALIHTKNISHCSQELVRWSLGNVVAKEDHNGNVFPRKQSSELKIDPIVAAIMALALWLQDSAEESIYETQGIRSV